MRIPCALGRTGKTYRKREGDGKTPIGVFKFYRLWWRDDRVMKPLCGLSSRRIREKDGWCDDVNSARYNKVVLRPCQFSHEEMQRQDHVYDYVIEIGYNMGAIKRGAGSAIFLHLARNNFEPTAGCIAVPLAKIRRLLAVIGIKTRIEIR